jgi:hypothetical protein
MLGVSIADMAAVPRPRKPRYISLRNKYLLNKDDKQEIREIFTQTKPRSCFKLSMLHKLVRLLFNT